MIQEAAEGGMTDVCRVLPKPMRFAHRGKLVWLALRDIVDTCMSNAALTFIYVKLLVPPHANLS